MVSGFYVWDIACPVNFATKINGVDAATLQWKGNFK
jgi:hypothetical protein|tara:strand:- start:101 stop:208 length:108 start_codon:yes stop_codon:yes gene_type:complete